MTFIILSIVHVQCSTLQKKILIVFLFSFMFSAFSLQMNPSVVLFIIHFEICHLPVE